MKRPANLGTLRRPLRAAALAVGAIVILTATPALGAIQLSNNPTAGVGALNSIILPDSAKVVFTAEMNTAGVTELFSASTSVAGTQIQLSDTPVAGGNLSGGLLLTPDGTTVVYGGDLETDQQFELFSASTSLAGTQVKLNDTPSHMGVTTTQSKLTPDGMKILYRADFNADDVVEMYSATVGMAGTQIRLSNTLVAGGDVVANEFFSTADGTRVVYLGDLDTDEVFELYSAPTNAASLQIKLNSAIQPNGDIENDFLLTSSGNRIIYRGDLDTFNVFEVYSAPTNQPGMQIKLSGPVGGGGNGVIPNSFQLAPDDARVIYRGNLNAAGVTELFSAPTGVAGMQFKLNNTPVTDGDVGPALITPDGARAVYLGDLVVNDRQDLFSAPLDMEGQQIQLNTNAAGGNVAQPIVLLPDSSRAIFRGDLNVLGQFELYSAPIDGSGPQVTLSTNPLGDAGDVTGSSILSPNGGRVAYRGVLTTAGVTDLYTASTTAAGTQVNLTNLGTSQLIVNPVFSPDGQFLVFGLDTDDDNTQDILYAADALGQGSPVVISNPLITGARITGFGITPDGRKVIYRANQDDLNVFNLFAANLPGTPGILPGDYNDDGKVDAGDYVTWRKNDGTNNALANDNGLGTPIGPAHYNLWRANFGNAPGAGSLDGQAVPEPSTRWLLAAMVAGLFTCHVARFRQISSITPTT